MTDAIAHAGELMARWMEQLWCRDIIDPRVGSTDPRAAESLKVINDIIGVNGWGNVKQADVLAGRALSTSYKGNGPPQWCGMTAGKAAVEAASLDPIWLPSYFASTDRLVCWGRYQRWSVPAPANPKPKDRAARRILIKLEHGQAPSIEPQRGDIVIVGDGSRATGNHVTVLVGYEPRELRFDAIAGNSGGVGPDGVSREGVSRRYYRLTETTGYVPMWLLRLGFADLRLERAA